MESSDNVKVCVRIRPLSKKESNEGANCVYSRGSTLVLDTKAQGSKSFTYDYVADETIPQEDIFEMVGKPIADACLEGYHGTIFAYGQTGSGKTFTIQGGLTEAGDEILEQRGVIPRTLDYVFSVINKRQQPGVCEFICKCSYLEIYRENITDLLNPSAHRLQIREDMQKGVYVEDLTEEVVESAADALRILQFGASHRHVARTGFMNHQSSRSHSVFTLYIQSKTIKEGGAVAMKYSRLHVIDLAGSERQKRTDTSGDRLKEAGNINKSLLILGNVIRALVDVANGKEHVHVQYRDSKLTFLLKDSLGGNSKTTIVATVSPAVINFGETLSTLKFAQRAKMIKNNAVINEDSSGSVLQLQMEIRKLKEALMRAQSHPSLPIVPLTQPQSESTMSSLIHNKPVPDFDNSEATGSFEPSSPLRNLRAQKIPMAAPSIDKIRQLESVLAEQSRRAELLEQEKERIAHQVNELQMLCLRKDYFLQASRLVTRLRESKIARLERELSNQKFGDTEAHDESLRQELSDMKEQVEYLNYQITHHPEILRFAIENLEQRELISQYEALYSHENGEYHMLRKFVSDLSLQIQRVISEKHQLLDILNNGASSNPGVTSPSRTQVEVLKWKYEQQLDKLQAEMDHMRLTALEEIRQQQQKEAALQQELIVLRMHMEDLERHFSQSDASHRMEKDRLYEQQQRTIDQLKTSYENELKNLQQGADIVESYNKKASLSILTLEKQLSQLAEEREHLLDELKEKEEDIRLLKRNLTQKDIENRRMSVFHKPVEESGGEDDEDFGEFRRAQMEKEIRSDFELQLKQAIEEKEAQHRRSTEELSKAHEDEIHQWLSKLRRQSDELQEARQFKEEYETLQEEIQFTSERLNELEEKKATTEKSLADLRKLVGSLEQENSTLKHNLEVSQQALRSERDQKVTGLITENDMLREEVDKLRDELEEREAQVLAQQADMENSAERISKLEKDLVASRNAIHSLTEMVETLRVSAKTSANETRGLLKKIEDCESVIRYKDDEMAAWKESEAKYEETVSERNDLREKVEELIEEARAQQESVKSLQSDIAKLEVAKEQARSQYEDQLRLAHQTREEAAVYADKLQADIVSLKFRAEQEKKPILADLDNEKRKNAELEKLGEELKEENASIRATLSALQTRLQIAQDSDSSISDELREVQLKLQLNEQHSQSSISLLRQENEELKREREAAMLKTSQLQYELTATKSKLANAMDISQRWEMEKHRMQQEIQQLREDIDVSMSYQREYLEDLRKSRASEDEAREQSELLMQQLQQLEMEKSALLQEQDSDKRVHEELNSQLHKLIGHQNLKQKIQLHASIKEENNKLKQQVQSLNLELRKSETRCKKIDAELRKFNKSVDVDGMLEEDEKLQKAIQLKEKENQHLAASLKDVTSQFNALAQLLLDVEVTSESEHPSVEVGEDPKRKLQLISTTLRQRDRAIVQLKKKLDIQQKEIDFLGRVKQPTQPDKENSSPNVGSGF